MSLDVNHYHKRVAHYLKCHPEFNWAWLCAELVKHKGNQFPAWRNCTIIEEAERANHAEFALSGVAERVAAIARDELVRLTQR